MSRSYKARYGMHCRLWKDSILESRHQKEANTARKRRTNRALRRTGKLVKKRGAWDYHKRLLPPFVEE